jgi:hypothetical protein
MRFVGEEGISVHELEARARTQTNLNGKVRWGYIAVRPDPADNRPKPPRSAWLIHATRKGAKDMEICSLRGALERLVGEGNAQASPLFRGLEPYPDGWRASVGKPATLPHYPMVLHRGGFPDGS